MERAKEGDFMKTVGTDSELFKIPPVIIERSQQLYDLVQNKSEKGRLSAAVVAQYLGRDIEWLRRAIRNGKVPFAFDSGSRERTISYIGILPFWQFETQQNMILLNSLRQEAK